jgi:nicotinamidase-related amidase
MTSAQIRDQLGDHLITPQNAALVLIDYQPSQFGTVRSMDPEELLKNVASGQQQPTVPELAELLEDSPAIDRTSVNSWEDADFVAAVRATGRRKLIFCALWTEVCMAFAILGAILAAVLISSRDSREQAEAARRGELDAGAASRTPTLAATGDV